KPAGGTLFSLRSRRQEECYFAVEVAGQDAIKLVHSGPNGTQSVLIPALLADGKWHRLALGIQDDSSVRSYFDCRWVSTDILKKNSLDIPEDADLVIGYLFSGELEDMVLVGDPSGVAQQCSTNLTPSVDPLLEEARPHRKPHKLKPYPKTWLPPVQPPRSNRIVVSDDEDLEGSGLSSDDGFDWSDWSECTPSCGLGVQHRTASCLDDTCVERRETRPCNSGPCPHGRKQNDCHCENGGVCKKKGECRCRPGFVGPRCQTAVCRPRCRNGGVCKNGVCQCPDHFTGSICQTPICDPICQNGGHCVGNNQCLCPPNTNGDQCQNFTCGGGCENGGTCVGPGLCECPHNATGDLCQEPICDPPCENSATCAPGNTCICQPHSSGPRCHDKKCEYRPVQEPYVRGYRRLLLKKHFETKCDPTNWKSCIKTVPEYQNVYERAYRTTYKCIDQP
ncbi:adhesive plaque matrix protein 2-like, partial [Cimex lectularius]|uniref:EGF-like domain-containing protein n=1 Tax=Cimex lectularius TaxID=79782 RepID=A0A8I6SRU6_CIMLE